MKKVNENQHPTPSFLHIIRTLKRFKKYKSNQTKRVQNYMFYKQKNATNNDTI